MVCSFHVKMLLLGITCPPETLSSRELWLLSFIVAATLAALTCTYMALAPSVVSHRYSQANHGQGPE